MEQVLKLSEIVPYENNARKNDKAVKDVAESIKQCGYIAPIIVDENNVILAGHTRYKALKKLGYKEITVRKISGLTDEQKRKYRLLDNKTNELAEWDFEKLKDEIDGLDFSEFDIDWGIEEDTETISVIEDSPIEIDNTHEPITKLGDIWQLGEHRLMCGDSTDALNINLLMDGKTADMIFTDPPYGYEYQSNMRTKSKKFDVLKNDDKILEFMPAIKDICKGFIFICTMWKVLDKWLPLFNKYYDLTNMIIWDKGGGGIGDLEHTFSTDYEIILCSNNGAKITGKRIGSVWNVPKDNASDYVHATQKPVKLSAIAIENTTNKNGVVLDIFGGSGSTLIACEQLNRKCYCMELDPKYCDVIVKRWETFTGKEAIKLK